MSAHMEQPDLPFVPALPGVLHPRLEILRRLPIARQRGDYQPKVHRGWMQANGRILLRCLMHREKTPSLTLYPEEAARRIIREGWRVLGSVPIPGKAWPSHFHCYGCGWEGSEQDFIDTLRTGYDVENEQPTFTDKCLAATGAGGRVDTRLPF